MADLPQMICQDKVPIFEFFSSLDDEDYNNEMNETKEKTGDSKKISQVNEPCNIETKLRSYELPFLGIDE